MGSKADGIFPKVPLYTDSKGKMWNAGAWRGIAGPKGLPKEVSDKLSAALHKIYEGKAYQDFLTARGFGALYADAAGFGKFMVEKDAESAAAMKAAGLSK
jgi:tripartite-type tricarboxylate transporter receptor subunit TctC